MASFADIIAGTKARRTLDVDFGGDQPVKVDVRKLSTSESGLVLERARAFARGKGVESPSDGDPLYDYAFRIETVALVCVDADSPPNDPRPFFSSSAQIYDARTLSEDVIAFIFAAWELFVDETSLQKKELSAPEMVRVVSALGGGDLLPFIKLSPGMRCSLARSMALQLLSALATKSRSTSPSSTETEPNDVRRDPSGAGSPAS